MTRAGSSSSSTCRAKAQEDDRVSALHDVVHAAARPAQELGQLGQLGGDEQHKQGKLSRGLADVDAACWAVTGLSRDTLERGTIVIVVMYMQDIQPCI